MKVGKTIRRIKNQRPDNGSFNQLTIGIVVDSNDPQQMGRLRAICPTLGDSFDSPIGDIPWAKYISPLGGMTSTGSRGPDDNSPTDGPVSYGMWAIPKVGARVLVSCIDSNTEHRIWLGCMYGDYLPHTMPHGRYTYQDAERPNGPLSSTEEPIQPLYDNLTEAFGDRSTNFEWRSRGADNQCSYVDGAAMDRVISFLQDDRDVPYTEEDGKTGSSTQGYARSRVAPNLTSEETGKNYDSQIYSWTTPGFHSVAMDDKPDNCRMRFRTSSGHQILLDDTNERIYVATAEGKCWIEMDQNGNIDVHTDKRMSFHAKEDINFTTDKAFRVKAEEGIHLQTPGEFRLHVGTNSHIKTENDMFVETGNDTHCTVGNILYIESTSDMNLKTGAILNVESVGITNILVGAAANLTVGAALKIDTGGIVDILGGGNINLDAPEVHLNDGLASAGPASSAALPTAPFEAFWTNRVPDHEPWGRIMYIETDNDLNNKHTPELTYNDPNVGKVELGTTIERGPFWHR